MSWLRFIAVVLMAGVLGQSPAQPLGYQTGHIRDILFVGWTADSSIVVSYAWADQTVRFWDPQTGRLVGWRSVATAPPPLELRPGLTLRITRPETYTIDVADVQTGRTLWHYNTSDHAERVVSPDGRFVAAIGKYGGTVVRILDAKTGDLVQKLEAHPGIIRGLSFSSDGRLLASADGDGLIRIRDASTGRVRSTLVGHEGPVLVVAFGPDGTVLASSGEDDTVRTWDVASATETLKLVGDREVHALAFSADGSTLASGGDDRSVTLWNLRSGKLSFSVEVPGWRGPPQGARTCCGSPVSMLRVSPSGQTVAVGCEDGYAYLLETTSRRMTQVADGRGLLLHAMHFVDDTNWEWFIGEGTVTQRRHKGDWEDTRELMSTDRVTAMTTGLHGELLVTGTQDGDVRVFKSLNGERLRAWMGTVEVLALALSPNNRFLAASGLDQNLRLWDVQFGALLWSVENVK